MTTINLFDETSHLLILGYDPRHVLLRFLFICLSLSLSFIIFSLNSVWLGGFSLVFVVGFFNFV